MENNDHVYQASPESALDYPLLSRWTNAKRVVTLLTMIFLPWLVVRRLKVTLRKVKNENSILMMQQRQYIQERGYSGNLRFDEIAGLLNWPELLTEVESLTGFSELVRLINLSISEEHKGYTRSNCWVLLGKKNLDQLLEHGYCNFKRTIGMNYFNFLVQKGDPHIQSAEALFPEATREACQTAARSVPHDPAFRTKEQFSYYYFIFLLWEYVKTIDKQKLLDKLEEPKEGNPIQVHANGKSMSQDLANAMIEYYSMSEVVPFRKVNRVLEIGGGYGRNAYVTMTLNPNVKMVMVDILPALYLAERYLTSVFKGRKAFKPRSFSSYEEVREEIEASSIVFLLPHQLELLPNNYFDLILNISSFGEMNMEQIEWYYAQINRLSSQYFYTKQWNVSKNPFDNMVLNKADYPQYSNWKQMYSRNCAIQTDFFETLYQVKR